MDLSLPLYIVMVLFKLRNYQSGDAGDGRMTRWMGGHGGLEEGAGIPNGSSGGRPHIPSDEPLRDSDEETNTGHVYASQGRLGTFENPDYQDVQVDVLCVPLGSTMGCFDSPGHRCCQGQCKTVTMPGWGQYTVCQ